MEDFLIQYRVLKVLDLSCDLIEAPKQLDEDGEDTLSPPNPNTSSSSMVSLLPNGNENYPSKTVEVTRKAVSDFSSWWHGMIFPQLQKMTDNDEKVLSYYFTKDLVFFFFQSHFHLPAMEKQSSRKRSLSASSNNSRSSSPNAINKLAVVKANYFFSLMSISLSTFGLGISAMTLFLVYRLQHHSK